MNIVSEGRQRRSGSKKTSDGIAVGVGEGDAVGVGVIVGVGEGVAVGVGVAVGEDVAGGRAVAVGREVAVGSAGETVGVTSPEPDVQPNNGRKVTNNTTRSVLTTQSRVTTTS